MFCATYFFHVSFNFGGQSRPDLALARRREKYQKYSRASSYCLSLALEREKSKFVYHVYVRLPEEQKIIRRQQYVLSSDQFVAGIASRLPELGALFAAELGVPFAQRAC
jgi:hypothetical protein